MFQLKVRDEYRKKNFFINFFVSVLLALFALIWIIVTLIFLGDQSVINENLFKTVNVITFFIIIVIGVLFSITKICMRERCVKKIVKEHLEIISQVKMPSILPKVVYVYTTHNDFMPSRMLQNMQQTYKNMEYWISDGSSNEEVSKKVKEFAQKHNINLFKLEKPSKDKSDNLNTFLKHLYENNHDFQYIVTSDSDVAFNKNFVNVAIRYFYSDKINRLGYVSSLLLDYNSNNFYNNGMASWETVPSFFTVVLENLNDFSTAHMYGASSITKRTFLENVNNGYFSNIHEDWATEMHGIKKMWKGIYSPLVVSKQSMEDNVFSTLKRYMRYFSWKSSFFKKNTFYKFNDEHSKSYWNEFNSIIFYVPKIFINLFILSTFISLVLAYNKSIIFLLFLIPTFLYKFLFWLKSVKLLKLSKIFALICVAPFWTFAHSYEKFKQWFKSVLNNQMVSFTPTRSIDKRKKTSNWSKIKNYVLMSFLSLLFLMCLNFVMIYFNLLNWKWWEQFLIIFVNVVFLYIFLGNISILILFLMSFIKVNKSYSSLDFIKFNNNQINFTSLKNEFFNNNKDIERLC